MMDVHGAMVSQVQLSNDVGITMMAWSCEKFKMEEGDEKTPVVGQYTPPSGIYVVHFLGCAENIFISHF